MKIVMANVLTVVANLFLIYGTRKDKKKEMLFLQILFFLLLSMANLLLNCYSAVVVNIICLIRNVCTYYDKNGLYVNILLIALTVVIGLAVNSNGYLGLLPIVGNLVETLAILYPKSTAEQIKIAGIISCCCCIILCFSLKNYAGSLFDFLTAIGYISYFVTKKKSV